MNIVFAWISLIAGIYFIILSLALNTKNFRSSLIFKIIPFFLGLGNIIVALNLFDIIALKF
jgi:hypothetical protein